MGKKISLGGNNYKTVPIKPRRQRSKGKAMENISKSQLRRLALKRFTGEYTTTIKVFKRLAKCNTNIYSSLMKKMIQHDSYMCPICCEILLHPISMECGHLYCMRCFEEYAAYNSQCCICRKVDSVIDLRVLQAADAVIRKVILPEIKDDINYLCREGDFAKWDKKRRVAIDTLTIGMLIDFLDNECKWRKAIVSGMLKTYDYKQLVYVALSKDKKQLVEANSRRIARYKFFSKNYQYPDWNIIELTNLRTHEQEDVEELDNNIGRFLMNDNDLSYLDLPNIPFDYDDMFNILDPASNSLRNWISDIVQ